VALVESRRAAGVRVHAILATHHHPDHIGGATALAERLGLPLWAHPETIDRLAGAVTFDRAIHGGDVIVLGRDVDLEAVHTPGHAPGHLCFIERHSGAMLAGDMVAGIGTILVDPSEGEMAAYLASLERLLARPAAALLPAHGPMIPDGPAKLREYLAHRRMREARAVAALSGAPRPLRELVPIVYADTPPALWSLAERSLLAHLEKLVRDGKAVERDGGWSAITL
jgi:glyoxylase-like metal-dependent hydrolase (beta-lactamase superfamily II)